MIIINESGSSSSYLHIGPEREGHLFGCGAGTDLSVFGDSWAALCCSGKEVNFQEEFP